MKSNQTFVECVSRRAKKLKVGIIEKSNKKKKTWKKLLDIATHTDEMINVKTKSEWKKIVESKQQFLESIKKQRNKSVSRITRISTSTRDQMPGKC